MFRLTHLGVRIACIAALALSLAGCPIPGLVGSAFLVRPASLDFGTQTGRLLLSVAKNTAIDGLGPIVLSTNDPWIVLDACTAPEDGCDSIGPLDPRRIPVAVDRAKMQLGRNRGTIVIAALNAAPAFVEVVAQDRLFADFEAGNRNPGFNEPVQFTSLAATERAGIVSHRWDFGDGATSDLPNPVHAYGRAGVYTVSLTVSDGRETETRTREGLIAVGGAGLRANFTASDTNIVERGSVAFTDLSTSVAAPITGRLWDFGDGAASEETNPTHRYDAAGVYTVSLTVTAGLDGAAVDTATETRTNYIVVRSRLAPEAGFALSRVSPFVNIPVQFVDLSSPGTAPIDAWLWEFGDGELSREQSPTHTYTRVGTFAATLTVTTAHGVSSKTEPVVVTYQPPTADFAVEDDEPSTGTPVRFTDRSLPGSGPVAAWAWDFGDGGTSTAQNPSHTYETPGVYDVTLTVTSDSPENNTDTEKKTAFVEAVRPPAPDFTFAPQGVFAGDEVRFTNRTVAGTETSVTYLWDFDGNPETTGDQSTLVNPLRRYNAAGTFPATLTAITPTRRVTGKAQDVVVDLPPDPDFTASATTVTTVTTVQFTDTTSKVDPRPVISREWAFGDGTTSTLENPQKLYTAVGRYTVSLTVRYTHSVAGGEFSAVETKNNYIDVSDPVAPTASFSIDNPCLIAGVAARFTDASAAGSGPIDRWRWDFGDGTTSVARNPLHTFASPGAYDVRLTVFADTIDPSFNSDTVVVQVVVPDTEATALDAYVRKPDANYAYSEVDSFDVRVSGVTAPATAYALRMTSQSWRTADDIYDPPSRRLWTHNLTIVVPDDRYLDVEDTALMFVSGGSTSTAPFTQNTLPEAIGQLALATGSAIAVIDNVPSQPVTFADEEGLRSRTEDEIIAYSFARYLDSVAEGDEDGEWPVLLPMVKAVVRAMDTVQDYLPSQGVDTIENFVVSGGSKRGWTTWLTGATDCRVSAIAPIVIDVLDMDEQMAHHRAAYGFWAPSIYPYAQERVFDRLLPGPGGGLLPEAEALLAIVDPYEYRGRFGGKPAFLMNSSGDEFFVPDSAQWYFGGLPGEKRLNYVPNTSHAIGNIDDDATDDPALLNLIGWYMAFTQDVPRPGFTWTVDRDLGRIVVTPDATEPVRVLLWQATNATARDFRREKGVNWTSSELLPQPNGTYVGQVNPQRWTAFFVQLSYDNDAELALEVPGFEVPGLVFTTEIAVAPDEYPEFLSRREDRDGIPLVVLYGTPAEMGEDYGRLMQTEAAALLPQLVSGSAAGAAALDAAWTAQSAAMDARLRDEIAGIAAGAGVAPAVVQRAHMATVVDRLYTGAGAAAWGEAVFDGQSVLDAYALNGSRALGAQNAPCVVMYIPDAGFGTPHAVVTFAGLAWGWTGLNLGGISVAGLNDPASANDFTAGRLHFLPTFREVLYDALSLRDAWDLVRLVRPTKTATYLFGDGRNEFRGSKLLASPSQAPTVLLDDDAALDPLSPNVLPGAVYDGQFAAGQTFPFLDANAGGLNVFGLGNAQSMQSLVRRMSEPGESVLNAAVDATNAELHLSYGTSATDASAAPFVTIELQPLLP